METGWPGLFFSYDYCLLSKLNSLDSPVHAASQFGRSQKLIHTKMLIAINVSMIVTPRGVDGC